MNGLDSLSALPAGYKLQWYEIGGVLGQASTARVDIGYVHFKRKRSWNPF